MERRGEREEVEGAVAVEEVVAVFFGEVCGWRRLGLGLIAVLVGGCLAAIQILFTVHYMLLVVLVDVLQIRHVERRRVQMRKVGQILTSQLRMCHQILVLEALGFSHRIGRKTSALRMRWNPEAWDERNTSKQSMYVLQLFT